MKDEVVLTRRIAAASFFSVNYKFVLKLILRDIEKLDEMLKQVQYMKNIAENIYVHEFDNLK